MGVPSKAGEPGTPELPGWRKQSWLNARSWSPPAATSLSPLCINQSEKAAGMVGREAMAAFASAWQ